MCSSTKGLHLKFYREQFIASMIVILKQINVFENIPLVWVAKASKTGWKFVLPQQACGTITSVQGCCFTWSHGKLSWVMKPIFINNIKNKSNYNSQTVNLTPIFYTSIMNTDFILVIHIELFFSTQTCALQHKTKGVLQEANGVLAHLTQLHTGQTSTEIHSYVHGLRKYQA